METFAQTIYVMDGYHFFKELKKVSKRFPTRNVRTVITNALKNDDRKRADSFLKEISVEDDGVSDFRDYLFGHWKAIRNRIVPVMDGNSGTQVLMRYYGTNHSLIN